MTTDDEPLKRLGGGRWQTRDERFTIEPQSGTWVVVDAEQTDDLGLPLVRGPFGSLTAAKAAISGARATEPATSPLAAKVAEHRDKPPARVPTRTPTKTPAASGSKNAGAPKPRPVPAPEPEALPEPAWIRALAPAERSRARDLIDRLERAGVPNAERLARREIVERENAVAGYALARAVAGLGPKARPSAVVELLTAGQAPDLRVEWRLVDGAGRSISPEVDEP